MIAPVSRGGAVRATTRLIPSVPVIEPTGT